MGESERERQYLTPAEMAAITGIHVSTIRKALARGEMPVLRMGRGRSGAMHVRRDAFDRWLASKEQRSTPTQEGGARD